ncbi:MAG TPA: cache domain-containing protein [Telluria sp.]|nr:cache domain-containing protein [Telluria sp.]
MKHFIKAILIGLCSLVIHTAQAAASERGSADEAVALVKKAVAYLKENGKEKAFAEFNNTKGQFVDRNLYIFVYNMNGKNLAHGANPRMVGKDQIEMRDVDGKYIVRSFIELTNAKGKGWVDYKWPNPVTKAIESKSSYVEKVDDVIVGCGIYKE